MAGSKGMGVAEFIDRKQALEKGLKFFYVGAVCKNGHQSKRLVSNYACYECSKVRYYAYTHTEAYKKNRVAQSKREYLNNKDRYYVNNAKRRAAARQATPVWLSPEHKKQIQDMYKNRKPGYDVDHIVPLNSCIVCGLNVPWNLQYLLSSENASKSNKL